MDADRSCETLQPEKKGRFFTHNNIISQPVSICVGLSNNFPVGAAESVRWQVHTQRSVSQERNPEIREPKSLIEQEACLTLDLDEDSHIVMDSKKITIPAWRKLYLPRLAGQKLCFHHQDGSGT